MIEAQIVSNFRINPHLSVKTGRFESIDSAVIISSVSKAEQVNLFYQNVQF